MLQVVENVNLNQTIARFVMTDTTMMEKIVNAYLVRPLVSIVYQKPSAILVDMEKKTEYNLLHVPV